MSVEWRLRNPNVNHLNKLGFLILSKPKLDRYTYCPFKIQGI